MFQGAGIPIAAKICAAVFAVGGAGFISYQVIGDGEETTVATRGSDATVGDTDNLPFVEETEIEIVTTTVADIGPDTEPPYLTISSPIDGSRLDYSFVRFEGRAEPGSILSVDENTTTVGSRGSWKITLELSLGANTVAFTAEDTAGNSSTAEVAVLVDELGAPDVVVQENSSGGGYDGTDDFGTSDTTDSDDEGQPNIPATTIPSTPRTAPATTVSSGGSASSTTASPAPFTANQQYGSSSAANPFERLWGQAIPGSTVQISSPYGGATAQANNAGNWSSWVYFTGTPVGQAFTITVNAVNGSASFNYVANASDDDGETDPGGGK
jgi:hypothetical protein